MNRVDLHALVWSVPMQNLAKDFGISDVALAKHCRKAEVPTPTRGWWAKKEAGQKVQVSPLPPLPIGSMEPPLNLRVPPEIAKTILIKEEPPDPDAPPTFPDISLFQAEVEKAVSEVRVATRTLTGHPIVERLVQIEEKKSVDGSGFDQKYYSPRFAAPIQQRRLRVLAALLGALSRAGCKVSGSTHAGEVFHVNARGTGFQLVLGVETPAGSGYSPYSRWEGKAGTKPRLRLQLGDHELDRDPRRGKAFLEWSDGEQPLEAQLTTAVRQIIVLAEKERRAWALKSHRWSVENRRRQEEERRKAAEQAEVHRIAREKAAAAARVKTLLDEAEAIGQADRIRSYVAEVRQRAEGDPSLAEEDVEAWAVWALAEADRIDPVASGRFLRSIARPPPK